MPKVRRDHIGLRVAADGCIGRPEGGESAADVGDEVKSRHVGGTTMIKVTLADGTVETWTAGGAWHVERDLKKALKAGRIDQREFERLAAFTQLHNVAAPHSSQPWGRDGQRMYEPDPYYTAFTEPSWYDFRGGGYKAMKSQVEGVLKEAAGGSGGRTS